MQFTKFSQLTQLQSSDLGIISKMLGSLFYYQPKDHANVGLNELFDNINTPVAELNEVLLSFKNTNQKELQLEHDRLFTSIGKMPAPAWGSVYLDPKEILFGDSTIKYRKFLQKCGFTLQLEQKEPEDQIGLMLMVLGMLLEEERSQLVTEMLNDHLMTWFDIFNQRFKNVTTTEPYLKLASLTEILLLTLCQRYQIKAVITKQKQADKK